MLPSRKRGNTPSRVCPHHPPGLAQKPTYTIPWYRSLRRRTRLDRINARITKTDAQTGGRGDCIGGSRSLPSAVTLAAIGASPLGSKATGTARGSNHPRAAATARARGRCGLFRVGEVWARLWAGTSSGNGQTKIPILPADPCTRAARAPTHNLLRLTVRTPSQPAKKQSIWICKEGRLCPHAALTEHRILSRHIPCAQLDRLAWMVAKTEEDNHQEGKKGPSNRGEKKGELESCN